MKKSLFLILILFLLHQPLSGNDHPGDENLQRLLDGEILLLEVSSSESGGSARVQVLVQASAKSVWDVITSCEQSFVFVDGLKFCEEIENSDNRALVHQVVKKGWLVPTQDYIFESLREPYSGIRFTLVEGNLKDLEGRWRFTEIPQGLLIDYQIRVQPLFPVPGFIVSYVMRKGMPDLIACIRGLAGGPASQERSMGDLKRCRGKKLPID